MTERTRTKTPARRLRRSRKRRRPSTTNRKRPRRRRRYRANSAPRGAWRTAARNTLRSRMCRPASPHPDPSQTPTYHPLPLRCLAPPGRPCLGMRAAGRTPVPRLAPRCPSPTPRVCLTLMLAPLPSRLNLMRCSTLLPLPQKPNTWLPSLPLHR